ncbi:DUF421 domain-containing protein [Arthrobacter sp. zg-Y20]|uniref:DUF421 domain-containing protein n=1 Tax=unclassified Arthrobacter TaxID=235627 RepID=UPI001D13B0B3|nr:MULTISPECIES: YetF domain-containing protein [unclassified Arthrobacter]MCC3277381.1 DUF421 domain-containing protein [Arthrobacter sp. zg-Y20]MDK1317541.1 DUF421 domain-containing protein [Arthrobacter sp. zg.Y20]WIB06962.1 DUF421 domain-containing protein [Arthrobacter sp. zg-Y20]
MWHSLGITPVEALWVVLGAVGIYAAFYLMVRAFGLRALATWSTLDKAVVIALGSLLGRVVLGYTTTLAAGVVGLATLFAMLRLERWVREKDSGFLSSNPILLMAGSEVLQDGLKKARVVEDELYFKLRAAGVRNFNEVAVAILETTGDITVLRRGQRIDPLLLRRVPNRHLIPADLMLPGQ